jgi:enoyl-CoA hydratase/carnithine racemase
LCEQANHLCIQRKVNREEKNRTKFKSRRLAVDEILTERFEDILNIQLNRPAKTNAMTSSMYVSMAELLNGAATDDQIRVVLWNSAGNSFSVGNDIEDFMKDPRRLVKVLRSN